MVSKMNSKRDLTENEVLGIQRMRIPSSARLQNNILELTQELPQYTDQSVGADVYSLTQIFEKVGLKRANFWSGMKPYAATLAAGFAVITLSSNLWLTSENDPATVDAFADLSVEQLAKEIVWQDLMLMQDELAFAGL